MINMSTSAHSHRLPVDWKTVRFGEVTIENVLGVTERGGNGKETVPLLKMGNVTFGALSLTNFESIDIDSVPKPLFLQDGDLLFNTRNTMELVGKTAIWHGEMPMATFDNNLLRVRFIDTVNPDFVCLQMTHGDGKKRLSSLAAGSTSVAAIYWKDLTKYVLFLPKRFEQDEIVRIHTIWGYTIDLAERLLAEKLLRHKWLVQQFLTGRRRLPSFTSPWTTLKLKDLVTPVQRQIPKPATSYDALGIRSHFKGTFAKQVEDPATVDMEMLYVAKAGDLIVNITFAWEGAIAIVPPEHDGRLVSHRFPTYRPKEQTVATEYLRYLVTQEKFRYLLADISPGGAGRNRVMSKKDFLKLQVIIPCLAEQRKIAEVLDISSNEIALLQAKAEALRQQKKGLMQQLLTGKKRVKI